MEVPFLAYPTILKISVFNAISISWVEPKKGFPSTKIQNAPNLPPSEGKELQRPHGGFWKWHDQGNNLGGCRSYSNKKKDAA